MIRKLNGKETRQKLGGVKNLEGWIMSGSLKNSRARCLVFEGFGMKWIGFGRRS